MTNYEHVALLKQGVAAWNAWRRENREVSLDLRGADLREVNLRPPSRGVLHALQILGTDVRDLPERGADLSEANLDGANLSNARLDRAVLVNASLHEARLDGAVLTQADLRGADLSDAFLTGTDLLNADLTRADLSRASMQEATLRLAHLLETNLAGADLKGADLVRAHLHGANLSKANLILTRLVEVDFTDADLTGCWIYGTSAWALKLEGAKQHSIVITDEGEPQITVDNIEVAQFIYLLLHNQKIRDVIDTITSKTVLILGRFTPPRKAILNALRDELRRRDYLSIVFDFEVPARRDITETVSLLARMARFIIADLTDPSSIPKELEAIVPQLAVPVQPLLEGSSKPYAMFKDYWKYDWVLPVYRYEGLEPLLAMLAEKVIAPAEGKVKALEERRRMIEAELIKPQ